MCRICFIDNLLFVNDYKEEGNQKSSLCVYHQKNLIKPVSFVPMSHYIKKNRNGIKKLK